MSKRTIWDYSDVFGRGSPEPRLFLITDQFRRLLLQACPRFFWESSWTIPLNDSEWAVIDDGVRTLMDEEMITVTVNPVINVTDNEGSGDGDCGCNPVPIYTPPNSPSSSLPIPPVGDQPPPVNTSTTPPDGWETETYNAARCAISNYGWTLIYEWVSILANAREGAATLVGTLLFLSASAPTLILAIFGANFFLQLVSFLVQLGAVAEVFDDFFNDLQQYMVEHRQELICKGYAAVDEIPLYEDIFTAILTHMQAIWDVRAYSDELISLCTNMLTYALPSAVISRLLYNEDEGFFANYTVPIPCDCGTSAPGEPWEMHYGIVAGHTESYSSNTEAIHELAVHSAGAGAGNSYQQCYDVLEEFWQTSPDELPFTAVTFYLTYITIDAAAGNSAERTVSYGGINNATLIHSHINATGAAVALNLELGLTYGYRLASHAALETDIEVIVPSKDYLLPQFNFYSVGYGAPATDWGLAITDFTMLT